MHPAVRITDIEAQVRMNAYSPDLSSILLIFSPYNGESAGINREFLQKVPDYHYHSGPQTACYCVGYSVFETEPDLARGRVVSLSKDFGWPLSFFYPQLFHAVRSFIQEKLLQKWRYVGGVDLLLFGVERSSEAPVQWERAAIAQSSKLLADGSFRDAEEMIRWMLNLNEAAQGRLVPDDVNPELARKQFRAKLKSVSRLVAGSVAGSALKLIGA